ncbi:MAG: peptidoglycan-binding protein [Lachnospiraceae bacterium]|nr:peptidoglycan-binding protein [Lachnospiraceae bacterium]
MVRSAQMTGDSFGSLQINTRTLTGGKAIPGTRVRITYTGEPDRVIEELVTDASGQTEAISLPAPPVGYSMEPSANQPYSEYDINVSAEGYESVQVDGIEILAGERSIQNVNMIPRSEDASSAELYVIGPHTLFGMYPPKILESEIKPVDDRGEIVLSRVVIPEYVVVHDGPPGDNSATDYYVPYKDYIKNVASSEIYATWPEETIIANVLAIQSFTLNRVFTEWYRNKGYDFTITSSTAYDHKWIPGRNIFESISRVVDNVFTNYLSRPNVIQPILTQYCDGKRVQCPGVMSQWGSKYLGDDGYSAIGILQNYYGSSIFINSSEIISGIPSSWPGSNLEIGVTSEKVRQLQQQLNVIANGYPLIPKIAEDGIYGPGTAEAVRIFQGIFGLPQSGITDFPTWYKISEIYVGVSRIAEYTT